MYFYPNECYVCETTNSLKQCSGCKMVSYCGEPHQKVDWKNHKTFCRAISSILKKNQLTHIFEGLKGLSRHKWMDESKNMWPEIILLLNRAFFPNEEEMLQFPRVCFVCFEARQNLLKNCPNCPFASFCKDHPNSTIHDKDCPEIKMIHDKKVLVVPSEERIQMNILVASLKKSEKPPLSMEDLMEQQFGTQTEIEENVKYYVSEAMSVPLTLYNAFQKLNQPLQSEIVVHVQGVANVHVFVQSWESILHLLPNIISLTIVFIDSKQNSCTNVALCNKCIMSKKKLTVEVPSLPYIKYVKKKSYRKPNLLAMFMMDLYYCTRDQFRMWHENLDYWNTSSCPIVIAYKGNVERFVIENLHPYICNSSLYFMGLNSFAPLYPCLNPYDWTCCKNSMNLIIAKSPRASKGSKESGMMNGSSLAKYHEEDDENDPDNSIEWKKRLWRRSFYHSVCYVCQSMNPTLACKKCKMIFYCGENHQRVHWPHHKAICRAILGMLNETGTTCVFDELKTDNEALWLNGKIDLLRKTELKIGKELADGEREMFLFPKTCFICHASDSSILKNCKCGISFCKIHMRNANHKENCKDFSLSRKLMLVLEPRVMHLDVKVLPKKSNKFPSSIESFIGNCLKFNAEEFNIPNIQNILLSDYLSRTLTFLYCAEYLMDPCFFEVDSLVIHIIGSTMREKYESIFWKFILFWFDHLKNLKIIFIGPEVETKATPSQQTLLVRFDFSSIAYMRYQNLEIKSYQMKYEDYYQSEEFIHPDFMVGFNLNIHESEMNTWKECVATLAEINCYFIMTAKSKARSFKDDNRMEEILGDFYTLTYGNNLNPYASLIPERDYETEGLCYSNKFITFCTMFGRRRKASGKTLDQLEIEMTEQRLRIEKLLEETREAVRKQNASENEKINENSIKKNPHSKCLKETNSKICVNDNEIDTNFTNIQKISTKNIHKCLQECFLLDLECHLSMLDVRVLNKKNWFSLTMKQFLNEHLEYKSTNALGCRDIESILLSAYLTRPLTFIHCANHFFDPCQFENDSLIIHVIGPREKFDTTWKFVPYWMNHLKKLIIIFIGPETKNGEDLKLNFHFPESFDNLEIKSQDYGDYGEYYESEEFISPNIIIGFDVDTQNNDSWDDLMNILTILNVPLILTLTRKLSESKNEKLMTIFSAFKFDYFEVENKFDFDIGVRICQNCGKFEDCENLEKCKNYKESENNEKCFFNRYISICMSFQENCENKSKGEKVERRIRKAMRRIKIDSKDEKEEENFPAEKEDEKLLRREIEGRKEEMEKIREEGEEKMNNEEKRGREEGKMEKMEKRKGETLETEKEKMEGRGNENKENENKEKMGGKENANEETDKGSEEKDKKAENLSIEKNSKTEKKPQIEINNELTFTTEIKTLEELVEEEKNSPTDLSNLKYKEKMEVKNGIIFVEITTEKPLEENGQKINYPFVKSKNELKMEKLKIEKSDETIESKINEGKIEGDKENETSENIENLQSDEKGKIVGNEKTEEDEIKESEKEKIEMGEKEKGERQKIEKGEKQKIEKEGKQKEEIEEKQKEEMEEKQKIEKEEKQKEEMEEKQKIEKEVKQKEEIEEKEEKQKIEKEEKQKIEKEVKQKIEKEEKQKIEKEEKHKIEKEEKQKIEKEEKQKIEKEEKQKIEKEEKQKIEKEIKQKEEKQTEEMEEQQKIEKDEKQKIEKEEKQKIEKGENQKTEKEEKQNIEIEEKQKGAKQKEEGSKKSKNKKQSKAEIKETDREDQEKKETDKKLENSPLEGKKSKNKKSKTETKEKETLEIDKESKNQKTENPTGTKKSKNKKSKNETIDVKESKEIEKPKMENVKKKNKKQKIDANENKEESKEKESKEQGSKENKEQGKKEKEGKEQGSEENKEQGKIENKEQGSKEKGESSSQEKKTKKKQKLNMNEKKIADDGKINENEKSNIEIPPQGKKKSKHKKQVKNETTLENEEENDKLLAQRNRLLEEHVFLRLENEKLKKENLKLFKEREKLKKKKTT